MLLDAIEVIATLGAAGYAAHRIENAWLAYKSRPPVAISAPQKPTLADAYERFCLQADHEERQKLLASPTGWLLDPFRYPTNPHTRRPAQPAAANIDELKETLSLLQRIKNGLQTAEPMISPFYEAPPMLLNPVQTYRMVMADPPCPACGSEHTEASATHGRSTSMWWCRECTAEFTLDGETKKSKKARKSLPSVLPCGCMGAIEQDHILNYGRESTCRTCFSTWEPRSNDKTGRTLGQGEKVRWSAAKRRAGFGEQDVPFDMPPPPSMR